MFPKLSVQLLLLVACCTFTGVTIEAKKHHHSKHTVAASPLPTTCKGTQNNVPVVEFDSNTATLVGQVANGTLYSVLPFNASTPLMVAHLYGDSYSMGVAYGQLLSDRFAEVIPVAYQYIADEFHLSPSVVEELLDITCNTTKEFTPLWHFDFLQGVSDGTAGNTTFTDIWRISMIPELIKASCSITGAWNTATATGGLLQLRALDWGTDGPFQQWPLLTTFHPNDGSFAYSSLGWIGWYGTITGYSSSNLAVSEKLWDTYKKLDNILGYPWNFLLADIMRFDSDIDQALARIGGAVRTCAIWVGLGQGVRPNPRNSNLTLPADFKLVGYSFEELHIYNPENFPVYPQHSYFPDLLFVNNYDQPSDQPCMNDLFHSFYGQLTAETIYSTVTALEQTGNMHIFVTDFDKKVAYIANATPQPTMSPAYNNGFIQFDMNALWNTPNNS